MKNTGPSKGRQVEVDFPEDHDWTALYDELEKVPPIPLKVRARDFYCRRIHPKLWV